MTKFPEVTGWPPLELLIVAPAAAGDGADFLATTAVEDGSTSSGWSTVFRGD